MSGATGLRRGPLNSEAMALCVLVHGRGQSPEEMESHILARLGAPGVAFALPRAPRGAWYDAKAVEPLTAETRRQLGEALDFLSAEMAALRADYPGLPLLLAGFSQGACLSIEYVCRGEGAPEGLVALTGCRVGTTACERPQAGPRGLGVYLSGSDADPWIPLAAMSEAVHTMGQQGMRLRADVFPGRDHAVSDAEIAMLDSVLADLADGHAMQLGAAR